MAEELLSGQRITVTLTGTVKYSSPSNMYVDVVTDDGRRHVIERPTSADYKVIRTMNAGEVWKTHTGAMFFVRYFSGINKSADGKKVIPAASRGKTYDTWEFLDTYPDAECVFSP